MEQTGEFIVFVNAKLQEHTVVSYEDLTVVLNVDERCSVSGSQSFLAVSDEDDDVKLTLGQVIFIVLTALVIFGIGMCIAYLFLGPRRPMPKVNSA